MGHIYLLVTLYNIPKNTFNHPYWAWKISNANLLLIFTVIWGVLAIQSPGLTMTPITSSQVSYNWVKLEQEQKIIYIHVMEIYLKSEVTWWRTNLGKRFVVFVPKIPYNVSYDIEFDMIRLRLSKAIVPLLLLISLSNFFKVKRYV